MLLAKSDDDCLYGKEHSIFYSASQNGDQDVLNELLHIFKEDENEKLLLEIERNHVEWPTFVCNVSASGCEELFDELLNLDEKIVECRDLEQATPLMR